MSKIVGVTERRQHARVRLEGFVRVGGSTWNNQKAIGRDISYGGCSFYVSESTSWTKNEPIQVFLTPPKHFVDKIFDSSFKVAARVVREEVVADPAKTDTKCIAVEFENDLPATVRRIYTVRRAITLAMIPLVLLSIFALKAMNLRYYWYQPVLYSYSLVVTGYILSRFLLALVYRTPRDTAYAPTVSIVIAVKDEEALIGETIRRCFRSKYPPHKIEVIVVNDGSTDRTLDEIHKVKDQYPNLILISFEQNKGKRLAMIAGTRKASGEIIVYMDSDSLLSSDDSLYHLVQSFTDPSVGGVSGHVNVLNADDNALTRMQEVGYFLSFRIMKAAESVFSNVTCCSGPLAAYRREYVMRVLDSWLDERFLRKVAALSDDRAMTRLILRTHKVLYNRRATVDTLVPNDWMTFMKQQVRWKKSWFRENLLSIPFMWRKHPGGAFSFYLGSLLPLVAPVVLFCALIYKPLFQGQLPIHCIAGFSLISCLGGFAYRLCRPNKKWICVLFLCVLYVSILSWQTYFAILTLNRGHWGTR